MFSNKWCKRYIELAELVSTWSKDPSTKVGAVIVNPDKTLVSTGFNGFPINVNDSMDRLDNRDLKYLFISHAEKNALDFANQDVKGCAIVLNIPFICNECAKSIIQRGINTVIIPKCPVPDRWEKSWSITLQMFSEANVEIVEIELC